MGEEVRSTGYVTESVIAAVQLVDGIIVSAVGA
jgi:hypothetical protein